MKKRKFPAISANYRSNDFVIMIIVAVLALFGLIMVFSASYYSSMNENGNPYSYFIKHLIWVLLGAGLMLFFSFFDYKKLRNLSVPLLVVSFFLLCLVLTPVGTEVNGASRWIELPGISIMPGEIAKIALIIFVSAFLSAEPRRIKYLTKGIIPLTILMGIFALLIVLQPNLSTAITVCAVVIGIMYVAGLNLIYLLGLGGAGAFAVIMLIFTDPTGYRIKRYTSFLDPFADALNTGYQVVQSLLALGTGGLTGTGFGQSVQKTLYLPEPQNDFILAIIGEEVGFIGIMLLLATYLLLVWKCINVALKAPDLFSTLLVSGITIMIGVQVLLNVAVVSSSMPPTGITLPFISYGGNATLLFLASIGIVLNVSRHTKAKVELSGQRRI
ncbi:MAG: putative lipid II flippase FtsW [Anaerovoracaceae bacterium]